MNEHPQPTLPIKANKDSVQEPTIFETMYNQHYATTVRFLLQFTNGDRNLAEEIAQDTFEKIFKVRSDPHHTSDLHDPDRIRAWIFKIAKNKLIDYLRSKSRQRSMNALSLESAAEEDGRDAQIPSKARSVTEVVALEETREELRLMIKKLPPHHQEVIDLYYFWGMNDAQIARVLEVPLGTVKSRLNRAREGLRILMGEQNATLILNDFLPEG